MYLLENRSKVKCCSENLTDSSFPIASTVQKFVRGVVQVVGSYHIPTTPKDMGDLRSWYLHVRRATRRIPKALLMDIQNSYVIVPTNHRFLEEGGKIYKKHGKVSTLGTIDYLLAVLN